MQKPVEVLSEVEYNKVLDSVIPEGGTWYDKLRYFRNLAIVRLMGDCGLRVGEVCGLYVSDFVAGDELNSSLMVRREITKTKVARIIPLSEGTLTALKAVRSHWWNVDKREGAMPAFYSHRSGSAITPRQVQRIVAECSSQAIGRKIHPHALRHTFATRLMKVTNIRVVQYLLGHKALSSTQIYTHPNHDDARKAIDLLQVKDPTLLTDVTMHTTTDS